MQADRPLHDAAAARRLFAPLARAAVETVAIAYLDPKWRIVGLRHVAGERGRARPSIRTLVRDALALDAAAAILAHNHPSGDPTPSAEDVAFTRDLAATFRSIGVTLVDHLVLASGGSTSFREAGLL